MNGGEPGPASAQDFWTFSSFLSLWLFESLFVVVQFWESLHCVDVATSVVTRSWAFSCEDALFRASDVLQVYLTTFVRSIFEIILAVLAFCPLGAYPRMGSWSHGCLSRECPRLSGRTYEWFWYRTIDIAELTSMDRTLPQTFATRKAVTASYAELQTCLGYMPNCQVSPISK